MEIENEITTDSILGYLQEAVKIKKQLNPEIWIDAAQRLAVFLGDEQDLLFDLQQQVAQKQLKFLEEQNNENVSATRLRIKAEDVYKDFKKQEARCKRIEEFIRVAKLRAKIAQGI